MRYRLVLEDGSPADPPFYNSNEPNWQEGDELIVSGKMLLVLRVDQGEPDETYRVLVVKPKPLD